ncbi:MAG: MFS transporter [Eubacteriales bacterium]|nr:MFS transporter [Eubacteriales bacterium]
MEKESKLTLSKVVERFSYGCGDFGCNIIYTAMSAFLMFYYTDYAGVNIAAVGLIMLLSRFFDGISDIIMGVIVDRTKSRFGKARPWLLRMCVPFALSGILLFSVPTSWTATPKLVYVFITYNLVSTVIYTAINVPYSALNALMTQDPYERSVLSIFRNLLATAGTLTINTFTLPLVEKFGDNPTAWTKTFCVFGLLAVAAFLINFFGTKERVKPVASTPDGEAKPVPFKEGLKALFQNKYWIMMTGMLALFFLMYSVNGGATVYYAKDILGDKNLVSTINGIFNIVQICGMFFIAKLVKNLGKRNVFSIGLILDIVGMLILNFSSGSMALIVISSIIRGIGNACGGATMWAMVSDTIDYGEWKTGYRTEGLVNSACSFGYKIGNGVGVALLGLILEMGGYVGDAAAQTASALSSIRVCFVWIPIAVYVAGLAIMKFYHLDEEFNGIIADLKARNTAAQKGE